MIKTIGIVAVVLLIAAGAILAYAATRPDEFVVKRTASIKATPERLSGIVADLRGWKAWSPFEKMDPNMTRAFGGAAAGKGAVYEWDGSGKAGKGRMEILEASPSRISIKLDFIKPFEGHNMAEFTFVPNGDQTDVTWAMYGRAIFLAKVVHLFFNMDDMIGREFETGLANLKALAEA